MNSKFKGNQEPDVNKQFNPMMKNVFIIILLVALVFLLLKYCNGRGGEVISIKTDTVYVQVKSDTSYIPKIDTFWKPKIIPKYVVYDKFDTLYLPEQITDSNCIVNYEQLKDYFTRIYTYKDTVKNKYGFMAINDTVTQNKIVGRGVKTDFNIPEVTKTITLTQPKRNEVYAGFGLFGNQKDFASGYEINLSLKTKKDRILGIGYDQLFNGSGYFKIEYRHKISLKK